MCRQFIEYFYETKACCDLAQAQHWACCRTFNLVKIALKLKWKLDYWEAVVLSMQVSWTSAGALLTSEWVHWLCFMYWTLLLPRGKTFQPDSLCWPACQLWAQHGNMYTICREMWHASWAFNTPTTRNEMMFVGSLVHRLYWTLSDTTVTRPLAENSPDCLYLLVCCFDERVFRQHIKYQELMTVAL